VSTISIRGLKWRVSAEAMLRLRQIIARILMLPVQPA
jgi:hypothetical protein